MDDDLEDVAEKLAASIEAYIDRDESADAKGRTLRKALGETYSEELIAILEE